MPKGCPHEIATCRSLKVNGICSCPEPTRAE
nr:MAG TPA: hypothetical protein [Bacteriophage sp.]